jgi:hypothetical protein
MDLSQLKFSKNEYINKMIKKGLFETKFLKSSKIKKGKSAIEAAIRKETDAQRKFDLYAEF